MMKTAYDLWFELGELGTGVALATFDEDMYTLSALEYRAVRIADRFLLCGALPEPDEHCAPIVYCRDVAALRAALDSLARYEWRDVPGVEFGSVEDLDAEVPAMPDALAEVSAILDAEFADEVAREERVACALVSPGEVLRVLVSGRGPRPQRPRGFVIDGDDRIWLLHGPPAGAEPDGEPLYFSGELEELLSAIGLACEEVRGPGLSPAPGGEGPGADEVLRRVASAAVAG